MKQEYDAIQKFTNKKVFEIKNIQGPHLDAHPGYKDNKKTKHTLPSGFWKFLVYNVKTAEGLLTCNKSSVL